MTLAQRGFAATACDALFAAIVHDDGNATRSLPSQRRCFLATRAPLAKRTVYLHSPVWVLAFGPHRRLQQLSMSAASTHRLPAGRQPPSPSTLPASSPRLLGSRPSETPASSSPRPAGSEGFDVFFSSPQAASKTSARQPIRSPFIVFTCSFGRCVCVSEEHSPLDEFRGAADAEN
jgi:hypothetical protein